MGYLGGKGNCYSRIVGAMPPHRVYIETHLGGGAVMRAKRRAERHIGIDRDGAVIDAWGGRDCGTELVHGDAVAFLTTYRFEGGEMVYSDPPYPLETRDGRNRYRCEYDRAEHSRLLDVLCRLDCMVLISGPPTELYLERLRGWRAETFTCGGRRGGRQETLWANFPEPARLHDPAKAGRTFREREAVKRRVSTMARKVTRMEAAERSLFFEWLSANHPEWASMTGDCR